MSESKVVTGYIEGIRWKWIAIILIVIIALMVFLNIQVHFDFTLVLIISLIMAFAVIIYLTRRKPKADNLDDLPTAIIKTAEVMNTRFPSKWRLLPSREKTHGRPLFDRLFLIQFDNVSQTFIFDRKDHAVIGWADGNLGRIEQELLQNELLKTGLATEIKGEQVKEELNKIIGVESA